MEQSYVFYNGDIIEEEKVSIDIRSKAFNYGLACFEGIRAYWDEENQQLSLFRVREHYERLLQSCRALYIKLPYTVDDLVNATIELLKKNNFKTTTYIRPVAYKGSTNIGPTLLDDDNRILIYCSPLGSYTGKEELSVKVTSWTRLSDNMLPPRTKATAAYLNSALASLDVKINGYDEAIFLTDTGSVCEGPGENIFIVRKGKLITPPPSDNILEGITRETVMELARDVLGMEVVERSIKRTELYACDEAFFSGTAMEITPICEIDDRPVPGGINGEVYKKIKALFDKITLGKLEGYEHYSTPVYDK